MPAAKDEKTREQIVALAKQGHSARAIEGILAKRKVKVGKTAIADLVKLYRAGALPDQAKAAAATSAKAAVRPSSQRAKPEAPAAAGKPAPDEPPVPPRRPAVDDLPDPTEVADLDLVQLAELAKLLEERLRQATREGDVKILRELLSSRLIVSRELAKLRPAAVPDPAKDPANLAARDEMRRRLQRALHASRSSDAGLEQLRAHLARAEEAAAQRAELAGDGDSSAAAAPAAGPS